MQSVTVSAVSMVNAVGQPSESLDKIARWSERARAADSNLVLFPELSIPGYILSAEARQFAEPVPGPSTERLTDIAKRTDIIICAGLIEADQGRVFNTQVLVGSQGVIGKQRKIHVPFHERPFWDGGSETGTFDIAGTKVGMSVCRDSFFSEYVATLYHLGAEVVLMPFCYPTVARSRYLEESIHGMSMTFHCWAYGLYGVVANCAGEQAPNEWQPAGVKYPGWAGVIGPWGQELKFVRDEGNGEAMVTEVITAAGMADRRLHPNFIAGDLRPEVYVRQ